MRNGFGFKDLVVFVLLLGIAVSLWLSMVQKDRQWTLLQQVDARLADLEKRLDELRSAGPALRVGAATASPAAPAAERDASWARAGVEIQWQPPFEFATDPAAQPGFRTGGEFSEIFEAQPAKLTPYINTDVYGTRVIDRVCENLANYDPKTLKLRGQLADAWQVDPDGLWLRVHINPKATFSDGEPVTAEDVRWTFMDFVKNPLIEAERSRSIMDSLDGVEAIGERTVEFKFNKSLFTNISTAMGEPILPKHWYAQFEPSQINQATGLLMGSGWFRLETLPRTPAELSQQWTPGNDIVLVRNERYWGQPSPLAGMRFHTVKDDLARLVAYRNGEGSMILPTSPQFNRVMREEPDFEKTSYALKWINMRSGYSFIAWQCGARPGGRTTPFGDVRVRRAMTMLLDRERMIRDIWDGIGIVSKGPENPESPASDPALKPLPFDPDQAKALLAEAGWTDRNKDGRLVNEKGDPFRFEYTYATGGEIAERIARFVKDSYGKAGIEVTTRPVDWSRYQEILKTRDFDAITLAWSANSPESDPRQIFHSESIKEGGDNFIQWRSEAADALIEQARRTMDEKTRMLVWRQFEAEIAREQPYTFVRVVPWLRFIKREFGNVHAYRTGLEPQEFFRLGAAAPAPMK
jgi:peptide/nickel transport system substrate-binding protein